MVAINCEKERKNWSCLVDDSLPPEEALELTTHLENCEQCRAKFESLCAESSWWTNSSRTLQRIERESGVFQTRGFSRQGESDQAASADPMQRTPKASPLVVISGLKPSQESGALGELGDYTVREVIGYGGMGTVLKAWDKRLSRVVAIKVLHPHLAMSGAARVRFAREAQLVASISHPNVVPIHDVADDHSQPYIVMGYVCGGSLQDRLDREGPLGLEESLRIALQIAEGLEAAHSHGLVHRDIKPANILLEARWQRVLITDFGLARALDDSSITASGHLAGTPQYMSPEQSRGDKVNHRSDLFSLGSVLYAMLAGRPPFRAENPVAIMQQVNRDRPRPVHEVQDHLPYWAHQLMEQLHAKNAKDRIGSAVEASSLIRSCLQHVQNPSSGPLPRGFYATKANRGWPALQFASVLLTVLLVGVSIANGIRPLPSPAASQAGPSSPPANPSVLRETIGPTQESPPQATEDPKNLDAKSLAPGAATKAMGAEGAMFDLDVIDTQLDVLWQEILEITSQIQ